MLLVSGVRRTLLVTYGEQGAHAQGARGQGAEHRPVRGEGCDTAAAL